MGTVYVYKLGDSGIYKVGKTKDLTRRQGTYETISTEPLIPYAHIETANEDEVETFITHRLQSRRWLGGPSRRGAVTTAQRHDPLLTPESAAFTEGTLERIPRRESGGARSHEHAYMEALRPLSLVSMPAGRRSPWEPRQEASLGYFEADS